MSVGEHPLLVLFVHNDVIPIMVWYGAKLVHSIFLWLISVDHVRLFELGEMVNAAKGDFAEARKRFYKWYDTDSSLGRQTKIASPADIHTEEAYKDPTFVFFRTLFNRTSDKLKRSMQGELVNTLLAQNITVTTFDCSMQTRRAFCDRYYNITVPTLVYFRRGWATCAMSPGDEGGHGCGVIQITGVPTKLVLKDLSSNFPPGDPNHVNCPRLQPNQREKTPAESRHKAGRGRRGTSQLLDGTDSKYSAPATNLDALQARTVQSEQATKEAVAKTIKAAVSTEKAVKLALRKNERVMLMYRTPWCTICDVFTRPFALAGSHPDLAPSRTPVLFLVLDCGNDDSISPLCIKHQVTKIPSVSYFVKGKFKHDITNIPSADKVASFLHDPSVYAETELIKFPAPARLVQCKVRRGERPAHSTPNSSKRKRVTTETKFLLFFKCGCHLFLSRFVFAKELQLLFMLCRW